MYITNFAFYIAYLANIWYNASKGGVIYDIRCKDES